MMNVHIISSLLMLAAVNLGMGSEWRWSGKVAAVTGASSGLGAAIAVQLADKGVIVVGMARRANKIKELTKKTNGTIHAKECDLLDENKVKETFRWIEENLGGVDILVNNAGTLIPASLINGSTEAWKTVLDLNVLSMAICTREAVQSMRKRGDNGHIINMNSISGHGITPWKVFPAGFYSPSKYAVTSLTETLAQELVYEKSKIKVTSISPGLVATELVERNALEFAQLNKGTGNLLGMRSSLQAEDVADAVVYILSTKPHVQIPELTITPFQEPEC